MSEERASLKVPVTSGSIAAAAAVALSSMLGGTLFTTPERARTICSEVVAIHERALPHNAVPPEAIANLVSEVAEARTELRTLTHAVTELDKRLSVREALSPKNKHR